MMGVLHGLLIGGIVLIGVLFLYLRMSRTLPERQQESPVYTLKAMEEYVKRALHDVISANLTDYGLSEEEYRRRKNKRAEMKKRCADARLVICVTKCMSSNI